MSTIRDPLIILSNYLQCASKLVMFVNNDTPVSTTLLIIDKTPLPFSSMLPYVAKDSWNHSTTTLFYSFIFWGGGGTVNRLT